jgi:hypothetical protein
MFAFFIKIHAHGVRKTKMRANVIVGLMFGRTECEYSWTKPRVYSGGGGGQFFKELPGNLVQSIATMAINFARRKSAKL